MADAELVVRDGTGTALVPARHLILTRAPEMARLAEMMPVVAAFDLIGLDNHDAAAATLKQVRTIRKNVEAFHDQQKGPINSVRTIALDLEKQDVVAWKTLETALGARLLAFDTELERQRKAEQDRLNREALQKAQDEATARAKALRDAAKAEDDLAVKKQLNAQARQLKDAPIFVAPVEVASPVQQTGTRTTWSADITDLETLVVAVAMGILKRRAKVGQFTSLTIMGEQDAPLAALEADRLLSSHPWLNTQAGQSREEFSMPGVVAVSKTGLSGR
jgi:hypothetical protein